MVVMMIFSWLWAELQGEVRKGRGSRPVLEILWNLLRQMQVRAVGYLRQQAPVPLLQRHAQLQGQAQMPLIIIIIINSK